MQTEKATRTKYNRKKRRDITVAFFVAPKYVIWVIPSVVSLRSTKEPVGLTTRIKKVLSFTLSTLLVAFSFPSEPTLFAWGRICPKRSEG